jgi:hypothetical protein
MPRDAKHSVLAWQDSCFTSWPAPNTCHRCHTHNRYTELAGAGRCLKLQLTDGGRAPVLSVPVR